jgi:hypothetical protein
MYVSYIDVRIIRQFSMISGVSGNFRCSYGGAYVIDPHGYFDPGGRRIASPSFPLG